MHQIKREPNATAPIRDLLDRCRARNLTIKVGTLKSYENVLNLAQKWAVSPECSFPELKTGIPLTCDEFFRFARVQAFVLWLMDSPWRGGGSRPMDLPAQKRGANTVKTKMLAVRTLWRLARDCGLCTERVPKRRHWPRINVTREDPISWRPAELRLILDYCLKVPMVQWWTGMHWRTLLETYFVTIERLRARSWVRSTI
jgi:hypothetical protein